MKTASQLKQETWAQHIEQWQRSGKTQADYCHSHNLKLHQFTYWRSKRKSDHGRVTPSPDTTSAFVPVSIDRTWPSELTLCLPNGLRIEGVTPASMKMLPSLLELLQ